MLFHPVVRNYVGRNKSAYLSLVTLVSNMSTFCSLPLRIIAVLVMLSCAAPHPVLAEQQQGQTLAGSVEDNFSAKYTELTKKILLSGIELERFSLNYRLHNGPPSAARKL